MPVGNITGISSGIDWGETVKLIMQIERQPVVRLEDRQSTLRTQLSDWDSIKAKLTALQSAAQDIDSLDEFLLKTVGSSDEDVLTATADSSAVPSVHEVKVNQLAKAHIHVHNDGWADANTTPVNSSGANRFFSYQYDGTSVQVTVPTGTTLQGLVNLINNDPNNAGVIASILNDGSGGAGAYHLVLSGEETGAGKDITILNAGGYTTNISGTAFLENRWVTTQSAQNAEIKVDGYPQPAGAWIESESNEIEGIIPGITLNLNTTSGGSAVNIEISLDKSAVVEKVESMVSAYNSLVSLLSDLTGYDTETKVAGRLLGDSSARSVAGRLASLINAYIPGTVVGDSYRSVAQAGLRLGSGGLLTLDSDKLEEALDNDSTGVARLFAFDAKSSTTFITIIGHSNQTVGGTYNFEVTYDGSGDIDPGGTNTIDGVNAVVSGNAVLQGAADSDVEGLLLLLTDPGDGPTSLSGTVTVYTGLSVLFSNVIDRLNDETEGLVKINRDRINDSIDLLDDKIETWERRLEGIEENYNRRFSAMEILIGQLRSQADFLTQAL